MYVHTITAGKTSPDFVLLQVVDTYDLVNPADERGDLHVDARHVLPAAAEAPGHQAGQLVVASVLANQRTSSITLEKKTF